MLDLPTIKAAMAKLGLTGTDVAQACGVSKEASSNWLSGESLPRPSKLAKLAHVLKLSVDELISAENELPEPIFAYRTKLNRAVSGASRLAAQELAQHLRQVVPFLERPSVFEPAQVRDPALDDEHIAQVAQSVRTSVRLNDREPIGFKEIHELFDGFGAVLVPVLWGLNKENHENALSVYLPESKTSFVVFNLGCKSDDFKYWLAHEYGHCLSLHKLQDSDGEKYAERFAQCLVFPAAAAAECLQAVRRASGQTAALRIASEHAHKYGVSVVTVVRQMDRWAKDHGQLVSGLETPAFWAAWKSGRSSVPSVALGLFGTDEPTPEQYIAKSEATYRTPIFKALAQFQREEGGRNPAFIAHALKVGLGDAVGLSYALWQH
jgi:transcriptional regulator with XRE-family HTH domain